MLNCIVIESRSKAPEQLMPEADAIFPEGEILKSLPSLARLLHFALLVSFQEISVPSQFMEAFLNRGGVGSVRLAVPPPKDN